MASVQKKIKACSFWNLETCSIFSSLFLQTLYLNPSKKYTVMHEPYTEPTLMHVALQWTKAISQPRMVEPMDPINATGGTSGSRKCYWQNQPKVFSPVWLAESSMDAWLAMMDGWWAVSWGISPMGLAEPLGLPYASTTGENHGCMRIYVIKGSASPSGETLI